MTAGAPVPPVAPSTVLVVDDESAILHTTAINLRARGYQVELASTGTQAAPGLPACLAQLSESRTAAVLAGVVETTLASLRKTNIASRGLGLYGPPTWHRSARPWETPATRRPAPRASP
jgi:hypothetical protein